MALGDGIRRNIRTVSPQERDRFRIALLAIQQHEDPLTVADVLAGAGGRTRTGDAHDGPQARHGTGFLPWHRALCNRFERMLRDVDSDLSLHYWDWNEDPHELFTPTFIDAGPDLPFEGVIYGAAWTPEDEEIVGARSFQQMRTLLEAKHDAAYFVYFGGTFVNAHISFHDPYALLLHSNVDRLFAMWQNQPAHGWRLDPAQVFGGDRGLPRHVAPCLAAPPRYDTAGVIRTRSDGQIRTGARLQRWSSG